MDITPDIIQTPVVVKPPLNDDSSKARKILILKLREKLDKNNNLKKSVLIFTRKYDPEVDQVGIHLLSKGIDYIQYNLEDFFWTSFNKQIFKNAKHHARISSDGKEIDLDTISIAWLRHFDITTMDFTGPKYMQIFAFQQYYNMVNIIQNSLSCKWINNPRLVEQVSDRSKQLTCATKIGFTVPPTLITNELDEALKFFHSHTGEIVVKALHHHGVEINDKIYSFFTRTMKKKDLSGISSELFVPCILQTKLQRKAELRITVVGENVFSAKLNFKTEIEHDDIHQYNSKEVHIEKCDEFHSETFVEQCRKLVKSFGLQYAALDFLIDCDDNPIFLEINPSGDWLWIENTTKQPITSTLSNLITECI